MTSTTTKNIVGILNPSSLAFSNDYYEQLLSNVELFAGDKITFQELNSFSTSNVEGNITAIVVVGETSLTLSDTFLQTCQAALTSFKGPKLLLSQGLPTVISEDLIATLNMFDQVTVRSKTDLANLKLVDKENKLLENRVTYFPDLIYLLQNLEMPASEVPEGQRMVGIRIPYTIASNNPFYKRLLGNFVDGLVRYYITVPNSENIRFEILVIGDESDLKVAWDLFYQLQGTFIGNVFPVKIVTVNTAPQTDVMETYHYIASHLTHLISYEFATSQLAIVAKIPCVMLKPLSLTDNEVDKLAKDLQFDESLLVPVTISDRYNLPSGLNSEDLAEAVKTCTAIVISNVTFPSTQTECIDYIIGTLTKKQNNQGVLVGPPPTQAPGSSVGSIVALSTDQINKRVQDIVNKVQAFNTSRNQYDPGLIALYSCYLVTKKNEPSKYQHGLQVLLSTVDKLEDLMANDKLKNALRWLIKDAFMNRLTYDYATSSSAPSWLTRSPDSAFLHQPDFSISLDSVFRQPSYEGIHRSGWAFVTSGLTELVSETASVFCDLYCDSTFSWMEEILNYEQVLPYKQPWIGFFHHGMFSEAYNVDAAIAKPSFQASLAHCRCLITLSEDLKTKLQLGLMQIQVEQPELQIPPVVAMVHPTEIVGRDSQFTLETFMRNESRKIIQVGSFYRNSFSIYALPLGDLEGEYPNELELNKCHLKAVDSARYFRPMNLFDAMKTLDQTETTQYGDEGTISRSICGLPSISSISRSICHNTENGNSYTTNNVYLQGLIKVAQKMDASVTVMEHVSNEVFDDLLAQNIVFIDLIDCSTANSILECIVRNTPLLINPLPAVIEALGENYPFYFTSLTEAAAKANSIDLIAAATNYLAIMDKRALHLDYFLNDFQAKLAPYVITSGSNRKRKLAAITDGSKRVKI